MGYAAVRGRIYKARHGDTRHTDTWQYAKPIGNEDTDDDAATEEQGGPVQAGKGKDGL
ncbi:hypothetical protein GCM10011495_20260 [Hymenobacter frigidus]|uniref:Uncharacterized protein n=1 Tax=Hymenobacter frigidus TaxID=1524095 RepID=A0ABQ2A762_9BACT|nr:hypothetical protein GCM10011495_20260 [Hymenobacter frigidus]